MAVETTPVRERSRVAAPSARTPTPVIVWWAGAGALILAFILFVLIRWITSPYFHRVHSGPSPVPDWMKVTITTATVIGFIAVAIVVYLLLIRPWRRERRVTTDGLLVFAFAAMAFQDPFSNYGGYWFLYNSWTFNMGSWTKALPGWMGFAQPGHMMAEPILWTVPAYIYFMVIGMYFGVWLVRKVRARWPQRGVGFAFLVTYLVMVFFDFIVENFMWGPTGLYTYPSLTGPSFFKGFFQQWPICEGIFTGFICIGIVALRYFTDDQGRTFVERGIDRVHAGPWQKVGLRLLALIAGTQIIFFFSYNAWAWYWGAHTKNWPASIVKYSYFTDGICGGNTGRLCPEQSLPIIREGSGWIGPNGRLVLPPGTTVGRNVPFDTTTKPSPF